VRQADINLEEMPLGQVTGERVDEAKQILSRVQALLSARPAETSGTDTQEVFESVLCVTHCLLCFALARRDTG
jgi:hypothetical protein